MSLNAQYYNHPTQTVDTFRPNQIPGLVSWWRTDTGVLNAILLPPSDGQSVRRIEDQVGGNDLEQTTGANQPVYKESIFNGKPIVRFDGVNDYMSVSAAVVSAYPFSIVYIGSNDAAGNYTGISITDISHATRREVINPDSGAANLCVALSNDGTSQEFAITSTTVSDGVPHVITGVWTSSSRRDVWLNGGGQGTNTDTLAIGSGLDTTSIGAQVNSTIANYLAGDIAEVMIYNIALSAYQRTLLDRYARDKYGVSI